MQGGNAAVGRQLLRLAQRLPFQVRPLCSHGPPGAGEGVSGAGRWGWRRFRELCGVGRWGRPEDVGRGWREAGVFLGQGEASRGAGAGG